MLSRSFVVTLITITALTLIGCGGGGKQQPSLQSPLPPIEKGYARITINWWNTPVDTSSLRGRYIPSSVDKITVRIYDSNNNISGSGVIQRPNSEIIIELPVGNNYVAIASGYDRNNNLIGEGISDPFNITASGTTDVRITITGVSEPQNNDQAGAILLTFINNQATGREIFHTPKDSLDWFKFSSRNDKAYTVHFSVLEATEDSNNWRIKVSVYDGNTLVKEASSPSDAVPPAPVTISKPASGTVYAKIEVVSGTFKGWYQLNIFQLDLGSAKVTID
jgi:hypothetical protein